MLLVSGTTCSEVAGYLAPFPSGIVNSPAVVTTANENGGSTFLAKHPNATRAWGAYGGVQLGFFGGTTSPEWSVDYTSCSVPEYPGELGAVFNATIGGTSGALINASTSNTTCALKVPSSLGLTFQAPPSVASLRKAI